jgi:hypothetical protein
MILETPKSKLNAAIHANELSGQEALELFLTSLSVIAGGAAMPVLGAGIAVVRTLALVSMGRTLPRIPRESWTGSNMVCSSGMKKPNWIYLGLPEASRQERR